MLELFHLGIRSPKWLLWLWHCIYSDYFAFTYLCPRDWIQALASSICGSHVAETLVCRQVDTSWSKLIYIRAVEAIWVVYSGFLSIDGVSNVQAHYNKSISNNIALTNLTCTRFPMKAWHIALYVTSSGNSPGILFNKQRKEIFTEQWDLFRQHLLVMRSSNLLHGRSFVQVGGLDP